MKYRIVNVVPPHAVVEYSTDDGLKKTYLNIRFDPKADGTLPVGREFDEYVMSYCPNLDTQEDLFTIVDWSVLLAKATPTQEEIRGTLKMNRSAYVDGIKVTTSSGRIFDGDEPSQNRMARAIIGLNAQPQSPVPTITWVLADNTPVQVTAAELTEALALAGAAQAAVWVI